MANEYSVNQADLTTVADAIRAKGGTTDALTFPTGFAEAIAAIASGGGTLAIKTGTVTLGEQYAVFIQHGCGKLPYAFYMYPSGEYPLGTSTVGAIWFRDAYAMIIRNSSEKWFNSIHAQYIVPLEAPALNTVVVDAEKAEVNPARRWAASTYRWIAIYEV